MDKCPKRNSDVIIQEVLKADGRLATCAIKEVRLYESGLFHWIYVDDTPLHLATVGLA